MTEVKMKMKIWVTLFASLALALGLSFMACDFGEEESKTGDATVQPDKKGGGAKADVKTEKGEEITHEADGMAYETERSGPCEEGESVGITKVRIADDPSNATLQPDNCGAGNPGADIDAVCVLSPEGDVKMCASEVEVEAVGDSTCENDKDDPTQVLGEPDGCVKDLGLGCEEEYENPECACSGGESNYAGYYSLNGNAIIVSFGGQEILCKDSIWVIEMHNPAVPGSEENYSVAYGTPEGNWLTLVDEGCGEATVEVQWEW